MAILTYWVARQNDDSPCYNIIAPTRKACLAQMAANPHNQYEEPVKREIYYTNAFDLFEQATSEGGGRT